MEEAMAEAALDAAFMTPEEYLARENDGPWRHEFVNGMAYTRVGGSDRHNLIAGALYASLYGHLPPRCQVFMADMKLRVRFGRDERFYYPDVFVSCTPSDRGRFVREEPLLISEVLSPSTERIDRGEKFEAYAGLPSLREYVLLSQDQPSVEIFRRSRGFARETFGADDSIILESVELTLPVAALYARALF